MIFFIIFATIGLFVLMGLFAFASWYHINYVKEYHKKEKEKARKHRFARAAPRPGAETSGS